MIYCGVLPRCRSTRGLVNVKLVLRAVLPALLVVFIVGCGSDEPALKEMTDEERAKQTETQKEMQMKAQQAQMESQQKNKQYQNATKTGS
jgi:hypothetical protein